MAAWEDRNDGVTQEEEEGQWGPLGSLLWYVVAGGKQCCSMRDRSKPQDTDATKGAVERGRPPEYARMQKSNFPDPFLSGGAFEGHGNFGGKQSRSYEFDRGSDYDLPGRGGRRHDRDSPIRDQGRSQAYPPSREGPPPPVPPSREALAPPAAAKLPSSGRRLDSEPSAADKSRERGDTSLPGLATGSAKTLDQRKEARLDAFKPEATKPEQPKKTPSPAEKPVDKSAPPQDRNITMPKKWSWPGWCLNFKSPAIEVYVVDEDSGVGRWVEGEPQSRVVDKANNDAYLCVEYEWDGEFYVQDFGPQHVRRRGMTKTVFESFS